MYLASFVTRVLVLSLVLDFLKSQCLRKVLVGTAVLLFLSFTLKCTARAEIPLQLT